VPGVVHDASGLLRWPGGSAAAGELATPSIKLIAAADARFAFARHQKSLLPDWRVSAAPQHLLKLGGRHVDVGGARCFTPPYRFECLDVVAVSSAARMARTYRSGRCHISTRLPECAA
jgi:hypothetical protein